MRRVAFLILFGVLMLAGPAVVAAGTVWDDLFPAGLMNAKGEKVETKVLDGKLVGLYFSGHWCPDCRRFSPRLVTFRNLNQAEFEVVLISYDKSEPEMWTYMTSFKMPWFTAGYKTPAAEALKERFKVPSIPALVVLSPTGKVVTLEGVPDVQNAPETCLQAWKANAAEPVREPLPPLDEGEEAGE
ncbi:MAG: redoxin domain-containing protein [Candidatus Riflebacteria bacterium]|nr:redoxin domain-containing protein [Candidatus Riflebacteria bacterium]